MWPMGSPLLILPVKGSERHTEPLRLIADLIERYQPVVLIEGRVLHCLGHHRAGVLLELHGKGANGVFVRFALASGLPRQQHLPHAIEDRGVNHLAALYRHFYCPVDIPYIFRGAFAIGNIGTIDRKAGDNLSKCTVLTVEGEITCAAITLSDTGQLYSQYLKLTRQRAFHDQMLVGPYHCLEVQPCPNKALIDTSEMVGSASVDKKAGANRSKVVSGSAVNGPGFRQMFMGSEYFFRHNIDELVPFFLHLSW